MTFLLDWTLRTSVILLPALCAVHLLSKRSAAIRHRVLTAAIFCTALFPALSLMLPAWVPTYGEEKIVVVDLPLPPPSLERNFISVPLTQSSVPVQPTAATPPSRPELLAAPASVAPVPYSVPQGQLQFVWLAGFTVLFGWLVIGICQLSRITSRSSRVVSGQWADMANEVARSYAF